MVNYISLGLKNIKKSMIEYGLFFFTLTALATMVFAFFNLSLSNVICSLSDNLSMLFSIIMWITITVFFIGSFVVRYTVKFMLERRMLEFRVYHTLGMSQKSLMLMLGAEEFAITILTLACGIIMGSLLNKPLTYLALRIFNLNKEYTIELSSKAIWYTAMCFLLFYFIQVVVSLSVVKSSEMEYQNQGFKKKVVSAKNNQITISIVALFLLTLGCISSWLLLNTKGDTNIVFLLIVAFLSYLFGIIIFYKSFWSLVNFVCRKTKTWKTKKLHLYFMGKVIRNSHKSWRKTVVSAILIFVSVGTLALAISMGTLYQVNFKSYYPYDFVISVGMPMSNESMNELDNYIRSKADIKESNSYYLYYSDNIKEVPILLLSDYNFLRRQIQLDEKKLKPDQFLINSQDLSAVPEIKKIIESNGKIRIGNTDLYTTEKYIFTDEIEQYQAAGENGYAIVVPDDMKAFITPYKTRLVATANSEVRSELKNKINEFIEKNWNTGIKELNPVIQKYGKEHFEKSIIVKAWSKNNSLSGYTLVTFSAIYFSLSLLLLLGSVIAYEQFSDIQTDILDFRLLSYTGVQWKDWIHELKIECITNFLLPAIIPLLITFYLVGILQLRYNDYFREKPFIIIQCGIISVGIYFIMFATFGICTYFVYRRLFNKEML